jgi:hypothetical protein
MKILSAIILSSIFSVQVFAAQFTTISKLSSPAAQKLAQVGLSIVKNEDMFGDNGSVSTLAFTRKATESNMATVKQLSYKNGATSDDSQEDFKNVSTDKIIDFALFALAIQDEDQENAFKVARSHLTTAINAIKADKSLEIYGNQHADEDGSWNILFVIDTKTNQVLIVKIGYSGT